MHLIFKLLMFKELTYVFKGGNREISLILLKNMKKSEQYKKCREERK